MSDKTPKSPEEDQRLLEGLFQLTVDGHTGGRVYDKLDAELYDRLLSAYGAQVEPQSLPRLDRSGQ